MPGLVAPETRSSALSREQWQLVLGDDALVVSGMHCSSFIPCDNMHHGTLDLLLQFIMACWARKVAIQATA
jgi:hypothetical protein